MAGEGQGTGKALAIVTGGSRGIGYELARLAVENGHDLIIAAQHGPTLEQAARTLRDAGAAVETIEADLARTEEVDRLVEAIGGRTVEVLCANAGHGLGGAFLDQEWDDIRHLIDTNVTGTLYLLHRVGGLMREQGFGRILITGSIAGTMPAPNHAAYHASKAFIDNFASAFRSELEDTGVTVTNLMPGATDTNFFRRAGLADAPIAEAATDDPADVARTGWNAMMDGVDHVTHGIKNKLQVAMASVAPSSLLARSNKSANAPGSS